MNFSLRQNSVHSTDRIRRLVAKLYIEYFKFLCKTMKWFSKKWKRIKSSLDQTYFKKKIQAQVNEIKDIADSIRHEVSLESQRNTQDSLNYITSNLDKSLKPGFKASQTISEDRLLSQSHDVDLMSSGEPVQRLLAVEYETPEEVVLVPQRKDLDSASRHLEAFDDRDDLQSLRSQAHHLVAREIPDQAIIRLRHWLSKTESTPLWIMGKAMSTKNSPQSIAAAHIILLAKEANVPCVWYICRPPVITCLETVLQQRQKLLTSMLYSLVRQLCLLIPPESSKDIADIEVLDQLDGSPEAVPEAIGLLGRLFQVSPKLICILDGLQLPEYGELAQYVGDLLDAIRSNGQDNRVKLLVTTSGFFANGAKLGANARSDCSQAPTRVGGRVLPGNQSLQSLKF
ncbi:uncharacterized protein PG998_013166 [Apiospora kogelbergensis]|uniref:uncharacterized protein n=1 Tax=Apiospora kogelbergensis TaxID=1337665 RepID=UPI00312FB47D